ncbi:MAG: hypothetical protein JWM98_2084 [Thermoleophilia bacterium]|nr:hypothetical protein [Thermoleophilia bacterium]
MNLAVAPAAFPLPVFSGAVPTGRPSPPDTGELFAAVKAAFPTDYSYQYTRDQQGQVFSAALSGARTGAELTSAAAAVKAALPTDYSYQYTKDQQLSVLDTALASPYELVSIGTRLAAIKSAMPTDYSYQYTKDQQVGAMVSTYAGGWHGGRPSPVDAVPGAAA